MREATEASSEDSKVLRSSLLSRAIEMRWWSSWQLTGGVDAGGAGSDSPLAAGAHGSRV